MDLFNLLCVSRKASFEGDLLVPSLIFVSIVLFLYGIIKILVNYGKKDDTSKKKFRRGLISFVLFIIFAIISLFVIKINSKELVDSCNNIVPTYRVMKVIKNLIRIFVPLVFVIIAIIVLVKNDENKKEKLHKFIRYIVLAISIFIILTTFDALIGIFEEIPESEGWTCWC